MLILLIILLSLGVLQTAHATNGRPVKSGSSKPVSRMLLVPGILKSYPSVKQINHLLSPGRKLSFKEKLVMRFLKFKSKSGLLVSGEPTEKQRKLGRISLIFGISIFVLLLLANAIAALSAVAILTLPLAIAGLILGIQSLKGNSHTAGVLGVVLSGAYFALLIIGVLLLILIFSAWN